MAVRKRKYRSGHVAWSYVFEAPGSTREKRQQITESGFATKGAAIDAEAIRRVEEQKKHEIEQTLGDSVAPLPKSLGMLLDEFFAEYAEKKLAPKTVERYREQVAYLATELLAMPLTEITPLHLHREWSRLAESGGHYRRTKASRPLSKKTVRNIASMVSSAFTRAIKWGLVSMNAVTNSEPPVPKKSRGAAISVAQTDTLIEAASGPWCLPLIIEMAASLGARRGEVLALRWSDIVGGRAFIARSLSQTKKLGLTFKPLKGREDTEEPRVAAVPEETLAKLDSHPKRQDEFRAQFGPDYRADLDLIFANPDGTPLKPDSISASVSALFKRLKIPKPKGAALHLLRHTMASQMLDGGVPLPVVSQRLGHSSVRVTADIYSHAIHGQDDEATRRLEEYRQRNRTASRPAKDVQ